MGGNAILYQGRIFIKDGLDNDMTAKKRILAFEIGTFFTRYVVFEDGRMGIPGTIATPVDGEEPFYQALAHIVSKQRAPLDGIAISVPGFIDTEKQVAVTAGALSILYGHEIGRKLQGYLDDPIPTWMENDANCAAMAENGRFKMPSALLWASSAEKLFLFAKWENLRSLSGQSPSICCADRSAA